MYIAISKPASGAFNPDETPWIVVGIGQEGQSKASLRRQSIKEIRAWAEVLYELDPPRRDMVIASEVAGMEIMTVEKVLREYPKVIWRWLHDAKPVAGNTPQYKALHRAANESGDFLTRYQRTERGSVEERKTTEEPA